MMQEMASRVLEVFDPAAGGQGKDEPISNVNAKWVVIPKFRLSDFAYL